jgi:hypothetical protein
MKSTLSALLAASVLICGLASLSAPTAAKRKVVYGYAPYAYAPPYAYGPAWSAYSTFSSGFSPYPYSDGFGAYARSSSADVPRGYGYYGYGPDPDGASGYGPFFGTNPWWRTMGRYGMSR